MFGTFISSVPSCSPNLTPKSETTIFFTNRKKKQETNKPKIRNWLLGTLSRTFIIRVNYLRLWPEGTFLKLLTCKINIIFNWYFQRYLTNFYFSRWITFLWQIGPIAISVDVSNQFRFRRKSLLRRLRRNCRWPRICGLFKPIKRFRTESVRILDKINS